MEKQEITIKNKSSPLTSLKTHLVDSTAIMVASTPVFGAFELFIAGMSNENSINSRFLVTGLTYLGLGRVFTKGMDTSRKLFKINKETSEKIKQVHDAAYAVAYNAVMGPIFYYIAGVRDINQVAIGTLCGMSLGLVLGSPMGYTVDAYRDFFGLKESERLPNFIKNQSRKVKLGLAGILAATSFGLTAGLYYIPRASAQTQTSIEQNSNLIDGKVVYADRNK
jgi:hypothetical protein